jgi:gas vesicle protein
MSKQESLETKIKEFDEKINQLKNENDVIDHQIKEYQFDRFKAQSDLHKEKLEEFKDQYFNFETHMKDLVDGKIEVIFDNREDHSNFFNALKALNAYCVSSRTDSTSKGFDGKLHVSFIPNHREYKIEKIIRYKSFDRYYYDKE